MKKDNHHHQLELAHDFIQYTGKNIFLTGRAGTGKTTFLHKIRELSPKRLIVVAPTGVAAINAGGVTIHSFFQVPFGPLVPGYETKEKLKAMRFSREKRDIIKSLDLLIIDEISMVRADLLDSVDEVLRKFRRSSEPFGGVQLLMIGDMQQLPPVVRDDEWDILKTYYKTPFFFSSLALQGTNYTTITLDHVFRQRDQSFIDILNKIRDNRVGREEIEILQKRYRPGFEGGDENYIILTTHNAKAKRINDNKLYALKSSSVFFNAEVDGNFPEYNFPTEARLELKTGAQVMFIKNDPDPEKNYYNGKIGNIVEFSDEGVLVHCPEDDSPVLAPEIEWQNIKYTIDDESREISESVEGTFRQVPLKLAWAITIHKSQGLTFDRVVIDSESAFAHGQVYVALSRCRSLEGIVLSTPFSPSTLRSDKDISGFNDHISRHQADQEELKESRTIFRQQLLNDLFSFERLDSSILKYLKVVHDNQRFITPGSRDKLESLHQQFRHDVTDISVRFRKQAGKYISKEENLENNRELQERIRKAVDYFSGKLVKIVTEQLEELTIETDNREINKIVGSAEENLLAEASFKLACLGSCREGFEMKKYLKDRAEASMESPGRKRKKKREKLPVSDQIRNQGLYDELKSWRNQKAEELGLPHYMILPLKTMRALSEFAPGTMAELKLVHGFGKKKMERYGEELLELMRGFSTRGKLEKKPPAPVGMSKKRPKTDTRRTSLDLYRSGKNIGEVAAARNLAVSTIEGHLAYFVGKGELDVKAFVDPDKLELILTFFEEQGDMPLSAAKDHLGDDITYSDLRFAREHLIQKSGSTKDA